MLMTQAIHLLVFYKVSIECTSTHIQQTLLLTSTTLQDTKVHHLTTQDYSTAHTFHYRWFVQLVKILSNQKSDSRLVMVLLLTHLRKVPTKVVEILILIRTATTDVFLLTTLCKQTLIWLNKETLFGSLFLCFDLNIRQYDRSFYESLHRWLLGFREP